ncbi:MAG: iron-containing alcohol dehydrogenase [Candidatus Nanopelagicales bacterium]|nr:iron-containing alcohol dehydrogenase [Candidatus Nanopelagicales bacterium]
MRFLAHTECFFGKSRYDDLHSALGNTITGTGIALIDTAVVDSAAVRDLLSQVEIHFGNAIPVSAVSVLSEPTYDQLDDLAALVRQSDPSFILAIGGGSLLDLAKGVAVLLENPGLARDYRGMGLVKKELRTMICVPTTAGTGSEATWTASFIDDQTRIKLGINGPNVFPKYALLEPALLVGSPRKVALSAGLDSLVHAVEAVSSPLATPPATALAVKAVALITKHLPVALNSEEEDSWSGVQMGAYLAGLAMLNSPGGIASGVSYPVGTQFHVPHGFAGGIILPYVIDFNTTRGYRGYELLNPEMGSNRTFYQQIEELYGILNVPRNLSEWGATGEPAIRTLRELTLNQRSGSFNYNPIPFDEADLNSLLHLICQAD